MKNQRALADVLKFNIARFAGASCERGKNEECSAFVRQAHGRLLRRVCVLRVPVGAVQTGTGHEYGGGVSNRAWILRRRTTPTLPKNNFEKRGERR